jgi:hypothetical protein
VPEGRLSLAPALPDQVHHLKVSGIPMARSRLTIHADAYRVDVDGLPDAITLEGPPPVLEANGNSHP